MTMTSETIKSIKGTGVNMRCMDFQFEPGKTYSLPEGKSVEICKTGFHACPVEHHPLSVFTFYPPAESRYFDVIQSGDMQSEDNKMASQIITFGPEISIADLVQRAVEFVQDQVSVETSNHATGYQSAASATGDLGAASATGYQGAASATGYQGAASATGYQGAASATGDRGAASATGDRGAASATGYQGAASATGYQGAASATGYQGAASATGDRGAASATGYQGAAIATGPFGRVMGGIDGVSLFAREIILENDTYKLASAACGITGRDGIKAGVWYVCKDSKLVEAE